MTDRLLTARQRRAVWWWGLPEKERAAIRRQFTERCQTDPVWASQVRRLLNQEADKIADHR